MRQSGDRFIRRGPRRRFTEDELRTIESGFKTGMSANWVASQIGCTKSSVVHHHTPGALCYVSGCLELPVEDAKFCGRHTYRPPAGVDLKLLTRGR